MNRRTDVNDGEADTLAGADASPFGPPTGPTVIPFPFRRSRTSSASAAGSVPPQSDPAPFTSLGEAAQSVILTIEGRRYPMNVPVQTAEEFDLDGL